MHRVVRWIVSLALAAGGVAVAGPAALASAAVTPAACTGTVQIVSLTFNPPSVPAGQSSAAQLVAQNCTAQSIAGSVTWTAQLIGPGGGIPAGCAVFDPLYRTTTFDPGVLVTQSVGYSIFAQCTATALRVTARIGGADGSTLATQSVDLTVARSSGTCQVSYVKQSEWTGGFVASVTITNLGTTSITGWSLGFTFPGDQRITNFWNATMSQSGLAASAGSLSYNRVIAPGASTSFGFQGSWLSSDAAPTVFTLNGALCVAA